MATRDNEPASTDLQPQGVTMLEAAAIKFNMQRLFALGSMLMGRYKQYEYDRRMAELQWERNARQFLGVYDPDIEKNMDINRSRAYPKLTRVKCVSMLSRLMNLLFPVDDTNWDVEPSPLPDLDTEDLQKILDMLMPPSTFQGDGGPAPAQAPVPTDEQIEAAIRDFARKRCDKLRLKISDQLAEIGMNGDCSYTSLCRKVLYSGIKYGAGVLKGPFVEQEKTRSWEVTDSRLVASQSITFKPCFDFVALWDYYPDLSSRSLRAMDGQFERVVLSKHELLKLKTRPDFIPENIDEAIREKPTGNYVRRAFETELLSMGPQINAQHTAKNKYEIMVWTGFLVGKDLADVGLPVSEADAKSDLMAVVWMIDNVVIKCQLDPWTRLLSAQKIEQQMKLYHIFIFEENESFLLGNGLPQIVRDSQMSVCASARMLLDNAAIMRNIEVNTKLLDPSQELSSIETDKVWLRFDDDPATLQYPAVREIKFDVRITELSGMIKLFSDFADQETFIGPQTGGDMQKGPSEPFRTAAGASMLRGDAALPFKDVVRNFDDFTMSVIGSIILFNRVFNQSDESIKGDFSPIARGATSLMAKEVLGIQLDSMTQTLTDQEKKYVKWPQLLRQKMRVRDLLVDDVVMSDDECAQVDANEQQQNAQNMQMQQQLFMAEVRDTLSSALKNIAQAGKNTANANATEANVILGALEKGLSPDEVMPQGATDGTGQQPGAPNAGAGAPPTGDNSGGAAGVGFNGSPALVGAQTGGGGAGAAAMPTS